MSLCRLGPKKIRQLAELSQLPLVSAAAHSDGVHAEGVTEDGGIYQINRRNGNWDPIIISPLIRQGVYGNPFYGIGMLTQDEIDKFIQVNRWVYIINNFRAGRLGLPR